MNSFDLSIDSTSSENDILFIDSDTKTSGSSFPPSSSSSLSQSHDPVFSASSLSNLVGIEEEQLPSLSHLSIALNTETQSLRSLGALCPSLTSLSLESSYISSVRDFGYSFPSLHSLTAPQCGLVDLCGLEAQFPLLSHLFIPFNQCTDLSPLSECTHLTHLDLSNNKIYTFDALEWLSLLPLHSLHLQGNIIYKHNKYRQIIANLLPELIKLDGKRLSTAEKTVIEERELERLKSLPLSSFPALAEDLVEVSYASITSEETQKHNAIKIILREKEKESNMNVRPGTAGPQGRRGERERERDMGMGMPSSLSSSSSSSSLAFRPRTASSHRPSSSIQLNGGEGGGGNKEKEEDINLIKEGIEGSSTLTYGLDNNGIIAGNFINSIRKGKKGGGASVPSDPSSSPSFSPSSPLSFPPSPSPPLSFNPSQPVRALHRPFAPPPTSPLPSPPSSSFPLPSFPPSAPADDATRSLRSIRAKGIKTVARPKRREEKEGEGEGNNVIFKISR